MFKLSITGADNLTSVDELQALTKKFPNLELAILYFPEKENQSRNPGLDWRTQFFNKIPRINTAIHICGESVFNQILDPKFSSSHLFFELQKAQRIQININARKNTFSKEVIQKIYSILLSYNFNLILQYHDRSKEWILPFIQTQSHKNLNILLDSSLGKGISPEKFEIPKELSFYNMPIGFAGGINCDNISSNYQQIKSMNLHRNYWLDLESGVRTDNLFDMSKANKLCESVFYY